MIEMGVGFDCDIKYDFDVEYVGKYDVYDGVLFYVVVVG